MNTPHSAATRAFVLEIGVEELPARFLAGLESELERKFADGLREAGLEHGPIRVSSSPRRASVYVEAPAERAALREKIVTGPPLRAAFDAGGKPTKAAAGFAASQGVSLDETFALDTEKGRYLAVKTRVGGETALEILRRLCPEIVSSLSFPKRMRWGAGEFTFARPLRWLLAMLDEAVVPFSAGEAASGDLTYGHRVHGPGPFRLRSAAGYFSLLREKAQIIPSREERAARIRSAGDALAARAGGAVLWKDSLLDEVSGLCEHPLPLLGSFDRAFLEMPAEVLLTSMEHHQKSFGLKDAAGRLLPHFLTVLNLTPVDENLVRKGWERVLRARLEDARFFWHADLRADFSLWLERLDKVIFLAGLGSMGDKTRRISSLAAWIAGETGGAPPKEAARAGLLSKADLVTEMVGEFDTLQGVMGSIYAAAKGESPAVSAALAEQYLPAGPADPLPATPCGAAVALADKADTLAGCFSLGLAPTGAADPYALRRAALGIARILTERKLHLDVSALFALALEGYDEKAAPHAQRAETLARLNDFFAQRLKNYFIGQGAETLPAEAVIAAGFRDVPGAFARLDALKRFSRKPGFNEAVLAFKRPANILRKYKNESGSDLDGLFEAKLLLEPAEKALALALEEAGPAFAGLAGGPSGPGTKEGTDRRDAGPYVETDFDALFERLSVLKPVVDEFFNQVMVMCPDEKLKKNRLNLLYALVTLLRGLVDFESLQV